MNRETEAPSGGGPDAASTERRSDGGRPDTTSAPAGIDGVLIDRIAHWLMSSALGRTGVDSIFEGCCQRIHAVIWYSDMRDSTRLADRLDPRAFIELLNRYFECTAGAVIAGGGEVLRFVGDAVLAIFPIREGGDDARTAAERALAAAHDAQLRLSRTKTGSPGCSCASCPLSGSCVATRMPVDTAARDLRVTGWFLHLARRCLDRWAVAPFAGPRRCVPRGNRIGGFDAPAAGFPPSRHRRDGRYPVARCAYIEYQKYNCRNTAYQV